MNPLADAEIAAQALAAGWWQAQSVIPLGVGHIHATWRVVPGDPQRGGAGVLQRISATVFPDAEALMDRVVRVVQHVTRRAPGWVPDLLPTRAGDWFHRHDDGSCWRLWRAVEPARTLQSLTTPDQAEAAGRAFGRFQALLADYPEPLPDPVPGFMQLDHYLARFDAVRAALPDAEREVSVPAGLVALIDARRDLATAFRERNRVIHADCKVNNLLFAADRDVVVCVLDLDTVMHGHWAWDAGDLIRSAAADPQGIALARFAAVVGGMRVAGTIAAEPLAWVLAPRYVTLMLAIRFLTDHLEGDRYFRTDYRGQNLARAQAQFDLLGAFERHERAMLELARRA